MKKIIIVILFLISIFIIGFLPVKDTDFGWHYRCGKQFITEKKPCLTNEFSYFLPDYKSAYPSFFYDVPLAFIYDRFGFIGISVLGSLIFSLSALVFINLFSAPLWLAIAGCFLTFLLSFNTFSLGLRSQILSYLFFLIALFVLKLAKRNKHWLFSLPLIFFFWVNTHIGFFLGLIILGFYLFDSFVKKEKETIYVLLVMILAFAATFINPFGFRVYLEIVNHAFSPLNKMIAEWVEPANWQIILIILLSILTLISYLKNKSLSIFSCLMIFFFLIMGLKARRNLPFFYTTIFYFLTPTIILFHDRDKVIDRLLVPILISLIVFLSVIQIPKTVSFDTSWDEYYNNGLSVLPCQAIKKYPRLSGKVYNAYEWGGFLIWQKPEIKVFVDGRMPAWKDENGISPYQVYLEIIQAQPGWNEKLNKLKTDYLLIQNGTFLDLLIEKEAKKYHWQEVYRDETAVIYKNTLIN